MTWCWLALGPERPRAALASAALEELDGEPAGFLSAWERDADPPEGAAKVAAEAVDPGGDHAVVSLVLPPPGVWLPFDDPAVSGALRRALAGPPVDVRSTLLAGVDRFVGALSAARGRRAVEALEADPFAAVFPARLLRAGAGLLGRMPPPAGPSMQRHGASNPWPAGRFPVRDRRRGP